MTIIPGNLARLAVLASILSFVPAPAHTEEDAPLELSAIIEMPSVKGRIDHFSIDRKKQRLYVAALGNDTVEIIDLKERLRKRSLPGFAEPQGVLYIPEFDRLFVANGRGNRVDVIDGSSLLRLKTIEGVDDADNIRYDAASRMIYVGYGKGALRVLDAATGQSAGDIPLSGHPEAFELEANGTRIFVNVPEARHVAVVDRVKRSVIATWSTGDDRSNFPMALDEANRRLFVATRAPSALRVYDIDSGQLVAREPISKDADDLFFDAARGRLYIICGEGNIDVFRQASPYRYALEATVISAPRARTGLFVPEDGRLYVAVPAAAGEPARIRSYRAR